MEARCSAMNLIKNCFVLPPESTFPVGRCAAHKNPDFPPERESSRAKLVDHKQTTRNKRIKVQAHQVDVVAYGWVPAWLASALVLGLPILVVSLQCMRGR